MFLNGPEPQCEGAAVGHGLGGVDAEVHDDLVHLGRVGLDVREVLGEDREDLDVGGQGAAEELDRFLQDGREQDGPAFGLDLAAEGQELLDEVLGARAGADDVLEEAVDGVGGIELGHGEVREAQDRGEQVVEVVGDAGGERADRFHLLGLADLALELGALGDVARDADDADDGAGRVAQRHLGRDGADELAVGARQRLVNVAERDAGFDDGAVLAAELARLVGGEEVEVGLARDLVEGDGEEVGEGRVGHDVDGVFVLDVEQVGGAAPEGFLLFDLAAERVVGLHAHEEGAQALGADREQLHFGLVPLVGLGAMGEPDEPVRAAADVERQEQDGLDAVLGQDGGLLGRERFEGAVHGQAHREHLVPAHEPGAVRPDGAVAARSLADRACPVVVGPEAELVLGGREVLEDGDAVHAADLAQVMEEPGDGLGRGP